MIQINSTTAYGRSRKSCASNRNNKIGCFSMLKKRQLEYMLVNN